ncbi:MAG: hypothetical protein Q9166_005088 [cf. Caloplaca sp. 2 TL-2023]
MYAFFKAHVRPADNNTINEAFTSYTFIVIDSKRIKTSLPQCTICTDAPDYSDPSGGPTLKNLRVPLLATAGILIPLGQLITTPSEALNPLSEALCSLPSFSWKKFSNGDVADGNNPGYIPATPSEARKHKQRAIELFLGWPAKEWTELADSER